ncbi:U6 snRNA phosphodiesterase 1 [Nematostella vectensis]|uniref:U6 snRNA phosphodiesterase 1 n=1 Tax=Nematostella vectensis TaxID=45351 RepID=UPI001390354A|nr:U6 snRNA phosphodiesterase 1 [Nematostella vectensis]
MSDQGSSGLSLLMSSYDEDEGSECSEDDPFEKVSKSGECLHGNKRTFIDEQTSYGATKKARKVGSVEKEQQQQTPLPIPEGILDMFRKKDSQESLEDHQGRVRTFEHFPGNWALHVYIPMFGPSDLASLIESFVMSLPSDLVPKMHLFPCNELHLSLSRTVPIRHYWINSIVDQLKSAFALKHSFHCILGSPEFYTNDDKTRSFIGLKILSGHKKLSSLVCNVDEVLEEFALPTFYQDPSFHVSIAWCLGDIHEHLMEKHIKQIQDAFDSLVMEMSAADCLAFTPNQVHCRIGNKLFNFPFS